MADHQHAALVEVDVRLPRGSYALVGTEFSYEVGDLPASVAAYGLDVHPFPPHDRVVWSVVTENVGVAVEDVGYCGQFLCGSFQEPSPAIGVVGKVEGDSVADAVLAEMGVQQLAYFYVTIQFTDVSVRFIEWSKFFDAGVALLFYEIFGDRGEILGEFFVVGRIGNPVGAVPVVEPVGLGVSGSRRVHEVAPDGASPEHQGDISTVLHRKVQHLADGLHLHIVEGEPGEVGRVRVVVVVDRFVPLRLEHDPEPLDLHGAYPAPDDFPVFRPGSVLAGKVLREKVRVEFHSHPKERRPGRLPRHFHDGRGGVSLAVYFIF